MRTGKSIRLPAVANLILLVEAVSSDLQEREVHTGANVLCVNLVNASWYCFKSRGPRCYKIYLRTIGISN